MAPPIAGNCPWLFWQFRATLLRLPMELLGALLEVLELNRQAFSRAAAPLSTEKDLRISFTWTAKLEAPDASSPWPSLPAIGNLRVLCHWFVPHSNRYYSQCLRLKRVLAPPSETMPPLAPRNRPCRTSHVASLTHAIFFI
jgi:hypothetical protein